MLARRFARLALPLSLALALPALGCGGSVASGQPVAADSAAMRAPVAQSAHGQLKLLGAALGDVPLRSAQRLEVEKLAADADARHADAREARKDVMLAIAEQVAAGSINRTQLQPRIDALVAALNKAQPDDRAAIERLHAILGPDQRIAFVDALEARVHERFGQMRGKHPMKEWATDLKLTDDQRAQLKALFTQRFAAAHEGHDGAPWAAHIRRGAKILEAFKQDRFVMDEVIPAVDVSQEAAKMSERMIGMAELALPILTPEQRALAAQKIRERATPFDVDSMP
jgi:Spy/CpxP family protein refolding chaperone